MPGQRLLPFCLLRCERSSIRLQLGQLRGQRASGVFRLCAGPSSAFQTFGCCPKAACEMSLLNLPVGPLFSGSLLLGFQGGQQNAGGTELLLDPASSELGLGQRAVDFPEALLRGGKPFVDAPQLNIRFGQLASQIADQARSIVSSHGSLPFSIPRTLSCDAGLAQRSLHLCEPLSCGSQRVICDVERLFSLSPFFQQGGELGSTPNGTKGNALTGEENRAAGSPQPPASAAPHLRTGPHP